MKNTPAEPEAKIKAHRIYLPSPPQKKKNPNTISTYIFNTYIIIYKSSFAPVLLS